MSTEYIVYAHRTEDTIKASLAGTTLNGRIVIDADSADEAKEDKEDKERLYKVQADRVVESTPGDECLMPGYEAIFKHEEAPSNGVAEMVKMINMFEEMGIPVIRIQI